jgi:hypothetical protein
MTDANLGYLRDFVDDEWRRRAIVAKVDEKLRGRRHRPGHGSDARGQLDARGQGASS